MKLLQKVNPIEVKRAFVVSDFIRHYGNNARAMPSMSRKKYIRELGEAKKVVTKLPEALLNLMIKGTTKKRLEAYAKLDWRIALVDTDEVRVWMGAGGLPKNWTRGSLEETGTFVREALKNKSKKLGKRAQSAIPGILKISLPFLQKEKYLLPIVVPYRMLDKSRSVKLAGDIDDGCMRSIALAASGKKTIRVYFGAKR